jgi:hypothetical protein
MKIGWPSLQISDYFFSGISISGPDIAPSWRPVPILEDLNICKWGSFLDRSCAFLKIRGARD